MKILAVETSGASFSMAAVENGSILSERYWHSGFAHSEKLVPAFDSFIKELGWQPGSVDRLAVCTGPGSFTGIRVGLSFARAYSDWLSVPLFSMTSLEILAAGITKTKAVVCPVIDALRDEVYITGSGGLPVIIPVSGIKAHLGRNRSEVLFAGNASVKYRDEIRRQFGKAAVFASDNLNYPRAGVLALSAEKAAGRSSSSVVPLYVRKSWAEDNLSVSRR